MINDEVRIYKSQEEDDAEYQRHLKETGGSLQVHSMTEEEYREMQRLLHEDTGVRRDYSSINDPIEFEPVENQSQYFQPNIMEQQQPQNYNPQFYQPQQQMDYNNQYQQPVYENPQYQPQYQQVDYSQYQQPVYQQPQYVEPQYQPQQQYQQPVQQENPYAYYNNIQGVQQLQPEYSQSQPQVNYNPQFYQPQPQQNPMNAYQYPPGYTGQIQNPQQNIIPISMGGYNTGSTGYYNPYAGGSYGSYGNPYAQAQYQQQLEAENRQRQAHQAEIWKKMSRISNSYLGTDIDIEEHVKKYDPVYEKTEEMKHEEHYCHLLKIMYNEKPEVNYGRIAAINAQIAKRKEQFPDDMSLSEYFAKAGELIVEIKLEEQRNKQRDISQLYDSNAYRQLLQIHGKNKLGYYSKLSEGYLNKRHGLNIDDMTVTLPEEMANSEYHKRRQKFLDSIFKN